MSTVDHFVSKCLKFAYGHAPNGEQSHRRLEKIDKRDDYSLLLSQRSNQKSVHKDTPLRIQLPFAGQTAK